MYEISRLPLQYFANATCLTHQAPTTILPALLIKPTFLTHFQLYIYVFYFIINFLHTACFICSFSNYLIRLFFVNVLYQKPSKKIVQNLPYYTNQLFKNAPFLFGIKSKHFLYIKILFNIINYRLCKLVAKLQLKPFTFTLTASQKIIQIFSLNI